MLNFDQSVLSASNDNGFCSNLSFASGPRVALGSEGSCGGSLELLLGPDVSSLGAGSGRSTSGRSGADAFPDLSFPIGTTASRGCADEFRGNVVGILHVSSFL